MTMIEKIERTGFAHIQALEYTRRRLWESACRHDDIEPDSGFVAFSDDNPFVEFMEPVDTQLREAYAACQPGGGYVGLRIKDGKAATS